MAMAANERKSGEPGVMIDKISGRVSYAVLSFGGFLGKRGRLLSASLAVVEI